MLRWIVLLRGINVGGNNILPMKDLRALAGEAGGDDPQTYIQSGNLVVALDEATAPAFRDALGTGIDKRFGFRPDIMMLPVGTVRGAVDACPFHPSQGKHLHIWFMAAPPASPDLAMIEGLAAPGEAFALTGDRFYLHAPDGIGRSKLAEKVERLLGVPATARNLNTCAKLVEMLDDAAGASAHG